MSKLLINNSFLVGLSIFTGIVGLIFSFICRDFMWFARSGSIVVGLGILLLSRSLFTNREVLDTIVSSETNLPLNNPEHYEALGETVPDWVLTDKRDRTAITRLSPVVSFLGTVVWGFGDLLNHAFGFATK